MISFAYEARLEAQLSPKEKAMFELIFIATASTWNAYDDFESWLQSDEDIVVQVYLTSSGSVLIQTKTHRIPMMQMTYSALQYVCDRFRVDEVETMIDLIGFADTWSLMWKNA
jgi:hypothetical protein